MNKILEGSKKLLIETIDLLGATSRDVVIVGGWGPFLRHSQHPGTRDVDILLPSNYSKNEIEKLLKLFLSNNFILSAKHDFQLCKVYKIGNENYIFNVDLLHPSGTIDKSEFVKLMDLDVTVDGVKVKTIVSINIQHGSEIYSQNLFREITYEGRSFNVLDGAGVVISKIGSCHQAKRERDIYDIFLSLQESNVLQKIKHLEAISPTINDALSRYRKTLVEKWTNHDESLRKFGVINPLSLKILRMD